MFERFTGSARQAVIVAQREAGARNAAEIGIPHLLLGLAYQGGGLSEMALDEVGLSFDKLVDRLPPAQTDRSEDAPRLPFSSATRTVLRDSLGVAVELGHNNVSSGHVLAALLDNAEVLPTEVVGDVDTAAMRTRVAAMLGSKADEDETPKPDQEERRGVAPRVPPPVQQYRRRTDFERAMSRDTPQAAPTMSRAEFDARLRRQSPVRQSRISEVILALVFAATIVSVDSVAGGWRPAAFGIGAVAVALFASAAALRTLDRPRKLRVLTSLRAAGIALIGLAAVLAMVGLAIG